ncbi:MAG: hypothetical protein JW849_05135 [Phycisphaerae bacterium]|nr:hypothetical protein [Phycisphaerae bacterium]
MRQPKKSILNRYARTDDGKVIIDVATARIEDLYNRLDLVSPYFRKDLDGNVANYLLECAREIGPSPFVIRLSLSQEPTPKMITWVRNSICSFFLYWKDLEKRRVRKMLRTSSILLAVGIAIVAIVIWMNRLLPAARGVLTSVLAEGLTVAAWVVMWESMASFLVLWLPRRSEIKLLDRLAHAPIFLSATKQNDPRSAVGAA